MATIDIKLEHHEVELIKEVFNSRISQWQYSIAHYALLDDQKESAKKKIKIAEEVLLLWLVLLDAKIKIIQAPDREV